MISTQEILQEIQTYSPKSPSDIIKRAYDFSAKAHHGQMRRSGDPYLVHPLEVAKILTQLKMDTASIVAGILHDTIEDTSVTRDQIEKNFGKDVAQIVDGVTKISKLQFNKKEVLQAENYRKMILAMSKDIRVILVKLADRLNNMRTLQYMSEAKQMTISQETLDIYVPLANRMGIHWIKEELENLSLSFLKPEVYKQIDIIVKRLDKNRQEYMQKVKDTLDKNLSSSIPNMQLYGRVKQVSSIYRKMVMQQVSVNEIHDLIAFRVLVPSIEHCYEALGLIHALWKPVQGRFKDYIAMPKANNYQSLHTTVVCFNGERVEFQIRTYEMHEIAEKGIAAHWKYKEDGRLDTKDEAKFRWLRDLVQVKDSLEFVDTVKFGFFDEEIYVFTPRGDVKNLCADATPVDFAYAIHSDLGDKCVGARVNGKMVPLNYKLESGDMVEIVSNKNHMPSKDWLDFVVTSKAKTHIRHFIRTEQRQKGISIGKNLLENQCKKHKISLNRFLKNEKFIDFMQEKQIHNIEEFYTAIAYGKFEISDLIEKFFDQATSQKDKENVIVKIFKKIGARNKNLVLVDQQDDVLVNFAKCCTPIPGDSIIGFVTRGRGITVHRTECQRIFNIDTERRVDVAWNAKSKEARPTRVKITAEDRKGMLAEITKIISEKDANITKVLVKVHKNNLANISLDVSASHKNELMKVIKGIENIRGVIKVERDMSA